MAQLAGLVALTFVSPVKPAGSVSKIFVSKAVALLAPVCCTVTVKVKVAPAAGVVVLADFVTSNTGSMTETAGDVAVRVKLPEAFGLV